MAQQRQILGACKLNEHFSGHFYGNGKAFSSFYERIYANVSHHHKYAAHNNKPSMETLSMVRNVCELKLHTDISHIYAP